jgi:hypothetical protein
MSIEELAALSGDANKTPARDYVVVDVRRNDCDVRALQRYPNQLHRFRSC